MNFLKTALLALVVVAGVLLASGPVMAADAELAPAPITATATVDAAAPLAPQAGTLDEMRAYELREAASPEVQEFAGGDVVVGISLLGVLLVVLLIILLTDVE